MPVVQPTKCGLRACKIEGADVRRHIKSISIYETMCKPYITAKITVLDDNNIINTLQLRGGERVSFAIDAGFGRIYESIQYVLSVDGESTSENPRTSLYTITTATESYFNDKASMVQKSDVNITATQAASQIHSEYIGKDAPLNVLMHSLGMIAKSDIGGFITSNKKPFKAIEDIIERAGYGGLATGSTVYFRAANEYVIAPLEHLFKQMSAQETFIQSQTWGSHWTDTFEAFNAIIDAQTVVEKDKSGRGGMNNIAAAAKGAVNLFDVAKGTEAIKQAGQIATDTLGGGLIGAAAQFAKGKWGGISNVLQMDSRRNEVATDQGMNAVKENMFQAQVKDSVNYYIRVPIQTGINVTVGKGVDAKLLPPSGDLNKVYNAVGGMMLVADVCHECFFDSRERQGTTIFRGVQISYAS